MAAAEQDSSSADGPLEPIGDPDDTTDFAGEHDETIVDADEPDAGASESPGRFSGGLDREGPP